MGQFFSSASGYAADRKGSFIAAHALPRGKLTPCSMIISPGLSAASLSALRASASERLVPGPSTAWIGSIPLWERNLNR
jgi:hypothetical protein